MRELIFISKIITIIKVGVDFAINFIYLFKYKESFCYLLAEGAICPWLADILQSGNTAGALPTVVWGTRQGSEKHMT